MSGQFFQGDDIIRWTTGECSIKLRKAACLDTFDEPFRLYLSAAALLERTLPKVPPHRTLITHHQQCALASGNLGKSLANGISSPKTEQIIIEEEHGDDLRTVSSLLQLRQDHCGQFGRAGKTGRQDISNSQVCSPFCKR